MTKPDVKQPIFSSLRMRILGALVFPMLAALGIILTLEYILTTELINSQSRANAENIARLQIAAMRHSMQIHDLHMMDEILRSAETLNQINRIFLIGEDGVVRNDNLNLLEGQRIAPDDATCAACHATQESPRPTLAAQNLPGQEALRVSTIVENSPECQACHTTNLGHVGILVLDFSLQEPRGLARAAIAQNSWVAIGLLTLVSALLYTQIDRLVTRRIAGFLRPLAAYSDQDFSARLPVSSAQDELDRLAHNFNSALEKIEQQIVEESLYGAKLQQTVIAERERIARELHDNLPQLLAYFNAKIGAISLLVQNGQGQLALENLAQLEEASRTSLTDVRETIMGLRASRHVTSGLGFAIRRYIELFREICPTKIHLSMDPQCDLLSSEPEIEIQSLRIVQEALSNVRRHARATQVEITATCQSDVLQITIRDDGAGFDMGQMAALEKSHYGLTIMRERAELHGGTFVLQSEPGKGVTIQVTFPINQPVME